MTKQPGWLQPLASAAALLIAAILIAAVVAVPLRFITAPQGYDQPTRIHWNTKNTTRFMGENRAALAAQVSQAVYPATQAENTPSVVLLYAPDDWQLALQAAALLRPLNAVLLPAETDVAEEIVRLSPRGSEQLDGARVVTLGQAQSPGGADLALDAAGMAGVRSRIGFPPRHAILVDPNDPDMALLAAPWSAYSGDQVVFDPADAPQGVPLYALGNVAAPQGTPRIVGPDPAATAVAFAKYEDPQNPLFGWGMDADTLTGYRAYTLALPEDPATAVLSANLVRRGKAGPLLWAGSAVLPIPTNDYLWSQRAGFWVTPSEGPFHHVYVLGGLNAITFPAQSQADYALEMGPYKGKGAGMSGVDMLAAVWVVFGMASAAWIFFHEHKFLPHQNWVLRLAWPLAAFILGPFAIGLYVLAYNQPLI